MCENDSPFMSRSQRLTGQVSGNARGVQPLGGDGERPAEVDQAGNGTAVDDLKTVLRMPGSGDEEQKAGRPSRGAYGVVLGDLKLEVHPALGGVGDAELAGRA